MVRRQIRCSFFNVINGDSHSGASPTETHLLLCLSLWEQEHCPFVHGVEGCLAKLNQCLLNKNPTLEIRSKVLPYHNSSVNIYVFSHSINIYWICTVSWICLKWENGENVSVPSWNGMVFLESLMRFQTFYPGRCTYAHVHIFIYTYRWFRYLPILILGA